MDVTACLIRNLEKQSSKMVWQYEMNEGGSFAHVTIRVVTKKHIKRIVEHWNWGSRLLWK
jgi:hypothetical protein